MAPVPPSGHISRITPNREPKPESAPANTRREFLLTFPRAPQQRLNQRAIVAAGAYMQGNHLSSNGLARANFLGKRNEPSPLPGFKVVLTTNDRSARSIREAGVDIGAYYNPVTRELLFVGQRTKDVGDPRANGGQLLGVKFARRGTAGRSAPESALRLTGL
jgi:hypothetical protein